MGISTAIVMVSLKPGETHDQSDYNAGKKCDQRDGLKQLTKAQ